MRMKTGKAFPEKSPARVRMALRLLVSIYLVYLSKGIIASAVRKTSPLPLGVTILAGAVFLTAAVAFAVYALRQYKGALAGAAAGREPEGKEKPHGPAS